MKQALTPVSTGITTIGVAELVPSVQWVLTGCKGPMPDNLAGLIAGILVFAGHLLYNYVASKWAGSGTAPDPIQPATASAAQPAVSKT